MTTVLKISVMIAVHHEPKAHLAFIS